MSISEGQAPEHPLLAALALIEQGLDAALAANMWSLSDDDDIVAVVQRVERSARRLSAVGLGAVHEVVGRNVAGRAGATSPTSWLAGLLALAPGEAAARVRLSSALAEGGMCAATGAALAAGGLSLEQAQVVHRTVRALPDPAGVDAPADAADDRADAEAFLVEQAKLFAPRELEKLGRHVRETIDPQGDEKLARDEDRQRAARELHATLGPDGMVHLRGRLDGETGALLNQLLEPLSKPRPAGAEGPDPRSAPQRRADGFAEILRIAAASGRAGEAGGVRPHLTVTLSWETLQRQLGSQAAELELGLPVSAQTARRLACDAGIVPLLLGSDSQPLDVGRASQSIPAGIRRALVARDRFCAFPGCDAPAARCEGHHCKHWADGGPTSLCNLCLLCGRHHTLIHHGGWDVHIGADGHPEFLPPPWIDPDRRPVRSARATLDDFQQRRQERTARGHA
jgi:hypothetical protein